jgi:hypothetical protein
MRAKELLKQHSLVRELTRQYRLRTGQPDWRGVVAQGASDWATDRNRGSKGQRVLIATSDGGYLGATRVEGMLALALTLRGAEVHVLLCDGSLPACIECNSDWYPDARRFARRGPTAIHCSACFGPADSMYRSLGIRVHRYSDHLSPEARRAAEELARTIPRGEIPGYQLDALAVGEHALAGALRFYARATLDDSVEAERILRRYFQAALLTTFTVRHLLQTNDFNSAVFHHGIYVPHGLIGEVARQEQVRVVNWHVAYRKRSFIFSHHDTYHHTLMNEPTEHWENMTWTAQTEREVLQYLKSRWEGTNDWICFHDRPQFDCSEIEREVGVDLSKPCVGLLTNVMWDAQLHYPANAFPNMLDWALQTIGYFARRPDLQLLIRVHPAEIRGSLRSRQPIVPEIKKAFPSLPPNVFIIPPESHASTYAAMSRCNTVIIYGTKTGVELTAIGIPVIVAGEAWIRNKGITMDAHSVSGYFQLLDRLPLDERLPAHLVERARRYAYHFFFRRMIPIDFVEPVTGTPGFEIRPDSLAALGPGHSKGLDVICDGILNGTEFIYPAEEQSGVASPARRAAEPSRSG